jgi:GNAT superfamily N-acetyltransferase
METREITIKNLAVEYAESLAALQPLVFPTLHPEELLKTEHFLHHIELFPDGQFVALADGVVVGSTTTMRTDFDFSRPQHSFVNIIGNGWLTDHKPDGEWLYGVDVNVHPDYRRMGIGKALYQARDKFVARRSLHGQITGAMLPGFRKHAAHMDVETYCREVVAGVLADPTLTMQLNCGFQFLDVIHDYLSTPDGGYLAAALIVKPHYDHPDSQRIHHPVVRDISATVTAPITPSSFNLVELLNQIVERARASMPFDSGGIVVYDSK